MLALAGVGVACQPTKPPPPPPPPTQHCVSSAPDAAAEYQTAFDGLRNAGTGWLASDGGLPAILPDGRVLWMFGDTFVGSGPGDIDGLINNSLVVQDDNCFRPLFGAGGEPLPDPQPGHWLWPTAAVVEGSNLRVFALHMEPGDPNSDFPFEYVRMDVATLTLPGLTHVNTVQVPVPTAGSLPSFGQTVVVADDGGTDYVYAYGKTGTLPTNHFVARTPLGQVLTGASWQVWDGATWSGTPGAAAALLFDGDAIPATPATADEGPIAPLGVSVVPGGVLGAGLDFDAFGDQLQTWDAAVPQGPFSFHDLAVDIWPGSDGAPTGRIGYGGRVVFGVPGEPIALWSVNQLASAGPLNLALYKVMFDEPDAGSVP